MIRKTLFYLPLAAVSIGMLALILAIAKGT